MIKNLRDLSVGQVCETRDHGFYVILCDESGRKAIYNERGTWGRIDETKNMFFDDGKKEVVRVFGFAQTLPVLDQISEGIKFVYETRKNTKALFKLWESESEVVTDLKREVSNIMAEKDKLEERLAKCAIALSRTV